MINPAYYYPPRTNATWQGYRDVVLVHESVKMAFLVLLFFFIGLIMCKECGFFKCMFEKISRYFGHSPSGDPAANSSPPGDVVITISDTLQPRAAATAPSASGDYVV